MNNNLIGRDGNAARSLDEQWGRMNAALARLSTARTTKPLPPRRSGRLIIALDLTGSRAESLKQARIATAAMFDAIKAIGAVAIQLVYYRGWRELKASKWHNDPGILSNAMLRLSCEAGATQIARVLGHVLAEKEKVSGVVFVGDHCEESPDELIGLASALGKRSIPLFIFHECADHDQLSLQAKPVFKRMTEVAGGGYVEFHPNAGAVLREVLSSVAAFAAAGVEGVQQVATAKTPEARQLQKKLLMLPAAD